MQQYNLQDLQTFNKVVETGSFSKAAEHMDISTAAVSRRISTLESALGVQLLQRTTRQLNLTDAGQQYYEDVQGILSALLESEERLREGSSTVRGNLRIAAPLSFGVQKIAPLLPEFLKQHPAMHIDLKLDDRQTDLYTEGVDLALRIGELRDSSLVATRLCPVTFACCASPAYLEQYGEPLHPDELTEHQCLRYNLVTHKREWSMVNDSALLQGPLSANNGEVLREAAIQGAGIVRLPHFIVEKALADGQLKQILSKFTRDHSYLYALYLSRKFKPAKVKYFIEFLRGKLLSDKKPD